MLTMHEMDTSLVNKAIELQEIPLEIRNTAPRTAVIATQDWCPDWKWMDRWLQKEIGRASAAPDAQPDVAVYVIVYNNQPFQQEFMQLKEKVWKNSHIPYVRYYRDGEFIGDSNQVSRDKFYQRFE